MHKLKNFWDKTLGRLDKSPRKKRRYLHKQSLFSRSLRMESLEERRMLAATLMVVSELEPNNTIATADVVNLGFGPGKHEEVDVSGTIGSGDTIDLFRLELQAGDILGVGVTDGGSSLTLLDASGTELMGSSQMQLV